MQFTSTTKPDSDGKYHIKGDGVVIGHIRREDRSGGEPAWVWRTLAIAVHNNRTGTCGSLEDAKEELKASKPVLIE